MLLKLSINNYAIIDELETSFSGNMNVLTGETGAGKSIIMGAMGLILGERADTSVLVNQERKCVVEGVFRVAGKKGILQFLTEQDLDAGEELVIRREINHAGKSRAFINDTPVNLGQLNQLSSQLVDLHQQFDTLSLGEQPFQREVIDALAGQLSRLEHYRQQYGELQAIKKEWEDLKNQKLQFDKEADYNQFQFNELEEAGFKENELEEIEASLKLLNNAEGIKETLEKVVFELAESESPMVQQLKILVNQLAAYSDHHPDIPGIRERLESAQIELKDITDDVQRISQHIDYSPEKMQQLEERLSMGYKLQKKHAVQSTNELLAIQQELEEKLTAVLNIGAAISEKEKEYDMAFSAVQAAARQISDARKAQVAPLEKNVNKLLDQVGMPNARIRVSVQSGDIRSDGMDAIEFLFDANKSGQFLPVRKVASGGELSRLMLCIKSLVAESIDLPTLIFDEIDTGISGEAARQVGLIMKKLGEKRQVICITHQPQIAGKADAHFFVYKEIVRDQVKTNLRRLTTDERITNIARMLSGEKPTAAALENAREMVGN